MPEEDLISFIKQRLTEGFDEKEIREVLLETGHLPEEIERAFKALSEKEIPKEPEMPKLMEEALSYQPKEKIPFWKRLSKKFLLPLIILVVFLFIGGVSAFLLPKILKPDPISLLLQETAFYLRTKINPESEQVKNLKENLNKFPYWEKLSQKISEEFEKLKKENPPLRNLDFTISDELILAWITPLEFETGVFGPELKEFSLILILPDPDLKKLEKLAKDVQEEIKKSKDWKLETEKYKGREIFKAIPTKESIYRPRPEEPKLEPSTTFTNGHFFLASKPEDLKKIIDVAEDQKITNIFKKDKIKNINSGTAYRKIKKYFPKDYLALFYGEFNWSQILKTAERTETVKEIEKIFPPLYASLEAALNLPFFWAKEIKEPEVVALATTIIAEKNELKTESYSLDLRKNAFEPNQFSFKESLAAKFMPEKIANRELAYYGEARNLKKSFDYFEKNLTGEFPGMTEEQRELLELQRKMFEKFFKGLKEITEVDLKEDIISLFEKNYAFSIYSEPTGKEMPAISFIAEIENENKTRENLLKIKFPKIGPGEIIGLEGALSKARDARRESDLLLLRSALGLYLTDQGRYPNSLTKLVPKYISILPTDPLTKKPYSYQVREGGKSYILKASLETGEEIIFTPQGREKIPGELPPPLKEEKVSFSKEIVDGFEIYSLPIFENLGLNFSIKEKKLILTFTKEGLINVLKSLTDQRKLKDSPIFAAQFKEIPKEITEISYVYPYGFIGVVKSLANSLVNYLAGMASAEELATGPSPEFIISVINEFLDKGVAPYLKVLKTANSYSFSPEKGLIVGKGKLGFEELPVKEKKATEEFWQNIRKWFEEKFTPLFLPPVPGPTPLLIY